MTPDSLAAGPPLRGVGASTPRGFQARRDRFGRQEAGRVAAVHLAGQQELGASATGANGPRLTGHLPWPVPAAVTLDVAPGGRRCSRRSPMLQLPLWLGMAALVRLAPVGWGAPPFLN